ncbi:MAG: OFA family MFS transporter [Phycisphaerales bacterium]|nr:MAG: OFA family MFS transporter [Phycisphaerales bacterium]
MSDELSTSEPQITNHGWSVAFAGMGVNLALGILYTWSVISKGIPEQWGWNESDKSWPYSVACLVFCIIMVPAGRLQDKYGPRLVAATGGLLVGLGFILAAMTTSLWGFVLAFGVLAGAGIGFGYASATPPAVKWFPAAKTGMVAGIVVSGFGLASVYAAPLAKWLMVQFGFKTMLLTLGIAFLAIITGVKPIVMMLWNGLASILKAPPEGYVPPKTVKKKLVIVHDAENKSPLEMMRTVQFYMIWFMYACGAGAGLMIIAKLAAIADLQAGISLGFILVAVLALGNGGGRILAGILSDKIGRKATMFICFVSQAAFIFLLSRADGANVLGTGPVMALLSALIGANYGANLALFPSITKDYYGAKNFGVNYGLVFTAWGVGGFMLAKLAGMMYVKYETFNVAYYGASAMLILAAVMIFAVRPPKHLAEANAK